MKKNAKKILQWWGVILSSSILFSCSSTPSKPLATSSVIPASQGSIKVERESNENTALEINVKHLAPPERVVKDATAYVVWVQSTAPSEESRPQNVGALSVDQDLNGTLATITPFQSFDVFITAEPSPSAVQPTGKKMLWTQVRG